MADLVVCFTGCAGAEEVWVSVFVTGAVETGVSEAADFTGVHSILISAIIFVISVGLSKEFLFLPVFQSADNVTFCTEEMISHLLQTEGYRGVRKKPQKIDIYFHKFSIGPRHIVVYEIVG